MSQHQMKRLALVVLISCLSVFALLTIAVDAEIVRHIDRFIFDFLQPNEDSHRLIEMLRDLTALGSLSVLGLVTLACAGWIIVRRSAIAAGLVTGVIICGTGMSFMLKSFFSRPRPGVGDSEAMVFTSSYPSGHAMGSLVTLVALAWLGARFVDDRRSGRYLLLVALLASLISGISRIGLGVHWPSDVLAGWLAGAAWLSLAWLLLAHRAWISHDRRYAVPSTPPASRQ